MKRASKNSLGKLELRHPLQKFPPASIRWPVFAVLLATTLWLGTKANGGGLLYNAYVAPNGIISLELAGTLESAEKIKTFWDSWGARKEAISSIYFDYIYLLFYSTTMALACVLAAGKLAHRWPSMGRLGIYLAWGQWVAALSDAIENFALLKILWTPDSSYWRGWPVLASTFASVKFTIILIAIIYILITPVPWVIETLSGLKEILAQRHSARGLK